MGRNGTADLALAVSVLAPSDRCLAKAAELGIVHRDIKPENIILARAGEVKAFGLARLPPAWRAGRFDPGGNHPGDAALRGGAGGKPLDIAAISIPGRHLLPSLAARPPFTGETERGRPALEETAGTVGEPPGLAARCAAASFTRCWPRISQALSVGQELLRELYQVNSSTGQPAAGGVGMGFRRRASRRRTTTSRPLNASTP